jgi:hypothetical protein
MQLPGTSSYPAVSGDSLAETSNFLFGDFQLLHHWNVSTANSLAQDQGLQRAMREVLPVLALNHEYLL